MGGKARAPAYTDDEIRQILFEYRHVLSGKQLLDKWGVTPSRLRTWSKRFDELQPFGFRELVIKALYLTSGAATAENLVPFLDYLDHAIYEPAEVRDALDVLVAEGIAIKEGETWRYDRARLRGDRPFVFR